MVFLIFEIINLRATSDLMGNGDFSGEIQALQVSAPLTITLILMYPGPGKVIGIRGVNYPVMVQAAIS